MGTTIRNPDPPSARAIDEAAVTLASTIVRSSFLDM
jgi:hypothetical protein